MTLTYVHMLYFSHAFNDQSHVDQAPAILLR